MGDFVLVKGENNRADCDVEWSLNVEFVLEQFVELWLVSVDHIVFELVDSVRVARADVNIIEGDALDWEPTREGALFGLRVSVGVDADEHALGFADVDDLASGHKGVDAGLERLAN